MSVFDPSAGLAGAQSRLPSTGHILVRGVEHRAELALLEFNEARHRIQSSLLLLVAGGVLVLFAGFALNILIAAIWWDTPHRVLSIGIAAALQLGAAVAAAIIFRRRLSEPWQPFEATFEQLRQDAHAIRETLKPHS